MQAIITQTLLWTVPECRYRVSIPTAVFEDIRAAVIEAYYAAPRGGVEIGGVFFGKRAEDSLQIQAYRPVKCQYLSGPSYKLSASDRNGLAEVLDGPATDGELAGMEVVGWYHSHHRSEIFLSPEDLEIYREYLPEPWQIALVVRPAHMKPTRAGFFFRDEAGGIKSDAPWHEFIMDPPGWGLVSVDQDEEAKFHAPAPESIRKALPEVRRGVKEAAAPGPSANEIAVRFNGEPAVHLNGQEVNGVHTNGVETKALEAPAEALEAPAVSPRQLVVPPEVKTAPEEVAAPVANEPEEDFARTVPMPPPAKAEEEPLRRMRLAVLEMAERGAVARAFPMPRPVEEFEEEAVEPEGAPAIVEPEPANGWQARWRNLFRGLTGTRAPAAPIGPESDRRFIDRLPGDGLIAFYCGASYPDGQRVKDISSRGAYVETATGWFPGTRIDLVLQIRAKGRSKKAPDSVLVPAIVTRTTRDGMGLRFRFRTPDETNRLLAFLGRWNANTPATWRAEPPKRRSWFK